MVKSKDLEAYFEKPTAEEKRYMDKRRKSQPSNSECKKYDRQKRVRLDMINNKPVGSAKE